MIKLSICMPTHNRAGFIGDSLDSVISQAGDDVEIVIVDGASTDNTQEVVEAYKKKFKNIVYYRGEKNEGVNRDMARTIELARGEYCWMLSDDDLLKPGAIARILRETESGCEIYLCNVTACSLDLEPIRDRFWLSLKVKDRVFDLHDAGQFKQYCDLANSIGALFSYMSSIVLRREDWTRTGYLREFDGTAYALAATLFSFLERKCRLKYICDPLVSWRNDNASFQFEGGLVKRFYLDFDGYLQLADKYLSADRSARDHFLRVMKREHPWYTIVHAASCTENRQQWNEFRAKLLIFGYSRPMTAMCYFLSRFKNIVSFGVSIKRGIVKNPRIQKIMGSVYHN